MRYLLALILLLMAPLALAETRVARSGDDEARIFDSPCSQAGVLAAIDKLVLPEHRTEYRNADVRLGGRTYPACWREIGNVVHFVYEDGDQGLLAVGEFKAVPMI